MGFGGTGGALLSGEPKRGSDARLVRSGAEEHPLDGPHKPDASDRAGFDREIRGRQNALTTGRAGARPVASPGVAGCAAMS
jgi:hypothetical protein